MKGPVSGPERKFRELKAEIISVGTELLLGHTIDTDAAYLSQELAVIGFDVLHRCTVGDNRGRLAESLRQLAPDIAPDFAKFTRVETYDADMNIYR